VRASAASGWRSGAVPIFCTAVVLAAALLPVSVGAQQLAGERLKLTVESAGAGWRAVRVQPRDPRRPADRGRIEGRISEVDAAAGMFRIGPAVVRWTPQTDFARAGDPRLAAGRRVMVRVHRARGLVADAIEARPEGGESVEILGGVTLSQRAPDGSEVVDVLGIRIEVPADLVTVPLSLFRDPDDRRPADQYETRIFGHPVVIGGEIGTRLRFRDGTDLDDRIDDDRTDLDLGAQIELYAAPSPQTAVYAELKAGHERDLDRSGGANEHDSEIARGETWIYHRLGESGLAIQLGRQAFREPREWWWDEDLDGIRLYWNRFPVSAELGLARELARVSSREDRIDPEEEGVVRILGRAAWRYRPDHQVSGFFLRHSDRSRRFRVGETVQATRDDDTDADLLWLGVRFTGDVRWMSFGRVAYWADLAHVRSREVRFDLDPVPGGLATRARTRTSVRGWAVDVGATTTLDLPHDPSLTLSYAFGSGDSDPEGRSDRSFRQTGLQDDNGRYEGVDRFRYYGELLDPELSNLHIATLSLGFPLLRSSSIEFVLHHYWQDEAVARLRGARLAARPQGRERTLGQEVDVVLGLEEWKRLEIEAVVSVFRSGRAFGAAAGELAVGGFLRMDWNF